jgi:cysteine desulfurase
MSIPLLKESYMPSMYLDYNATTPVDPLVVKKLLPYLHERFGNPSSSHEYGREAKEAVENARAQLADLLGADPTEIVFTSGGTEADNQALIATARAYSKRGRHIITTEIEHPAVLNPLLWLEEQGFSLSILPVDTYGLIDPAVVERAITPHTTIISVMHANNEVGTIQPLAEIGAIARRQGIVFHTDAAQSVGKIPTRVNELQVDLLTVAGHKFYAPKGVGALYVRKGTAIEPYLYGAGHESGRRAGTENVPYIVALGAAAELAQQRIAAGCAGIVALRDRLQSRLQELIGGVELNGHPVERLPNTLNVSFSGIIGAELLEQIPEIAASTGAACHGGVSKLSGVLMAMGLSRERNLGAVRFSIGQWTTRDEVGRAAELVAAGVRKLRREDPIV